MHSAVGVSQACPFDLHSLVPVPWSILKLGDDHPDAITWLWKHWGTTWTLRRVEERSLPTPLLAALPPEHTGVEFEFWSADWTPWPALVSLRERWPELRFDLVFEAEPPVEVAARKRPPTKKKNRRTLPRAMREIGPAHGTLRRTRGKSLPPGQKTQP